MNVPEHLPKNWSLDGVYTPKQAATLLGISTRMVNRWAYGESGYCSAIIPQHKSLERELITFLDFVQMLAIRDIRAAQAVSLQKIRKTVIKAREHGIMFPFATKHRTYVFRDDVVIRLDSGQLLQATGKYRNHSLIEPVVYSYLKDLGFNNRGIANEYRPLRRKHRSVILAPNIHYGAPTVIPCHYTVSTLLQAVESEGSVEAAADACGINPVDVKLAIEYSEKIAA